MLKRVSDWWAEQKNLGATRGILIGFALVGLFAVLALIPPSSSEPPTLSPEVVDDLSAAAAEEREATALAILPFLEEFAQTRSTEDSKADPIADLRLDMQSVKSETTAALKAISTEELQSNADVQQAFADALKAVAPRPTMRGLRPLPITRSAPVCQSMSDSRILRSSLARSPVS